MSTDGWASFEQFELWIWPGHALEASHPGDCESEILSVMDRDYIKRQLDKLDPLKVRQELYEYGAWDDNQLNDHTTNLARLVWIATGNIAEEMKP